MGNTVSGWVCLGSDVGALCRPPGKSGLHRPYIRYSVLNPTAKAAGRSARRGTKKCGTYKARGVRWTTSAHHLSCHKANKISRAVNKNVDQSQIVFHNDGSFSHKKFPSFRCDTGALGGFCRDGRKVVFWSGIPLRAVRAGSHGCPQRPFVGGLSAFTTVLSTAHMSCRQARGIIKKRASSGPDDRFAKGGHFRIGPFSCRVYRAFEEVWRAACRDGSRRFRVDYGA